MILESGFSITGIYLKEIFGLLIAEEHIKLLGSFNTITIINCLTKNLFKILVSITIFGREIVNKNKQTVVQSFVYHNLLL